jgi:ActR/RegA family two-component response regulator
MLTPSDHDKTTSDGAKPRVMVIDDDQFIREIAAAELSERFTALSCAGVEEALGQLATFTELHAVIADLRLARIGHG